MMQNNYRKTRDSVAIEESKECSSIMDLKLALDKAIENLDKETPEWRDHKSFWVCEENGQNESEFFSTLVLHFTRYMTQEEIDADNARKKIAHESSLESMRNLIKKNYDEAVAYIEELKSLAT